MDRLVDCLLRGFFKNWRRLDRNTYTLHWRSSEFKELIDLSF
jgi:hypothetical protein